MQRQLAQSTIQALTTQSTVDPTKTLGERLLSGAMTRYKDNNGIRDKDLIELNKAITENVFLPGPPPIAPRATAFAQDLVYLLSQQELFQLTCLMCETEVDQREDQAFRGSTVAKELVKAEAALYAQVDDQFKQQPHPTMIHHLQSVDNSPAKDFNAIFKNPKDHSMHPRDFYIFCMFNMLGTKPSESDIQANSQNFYQTYVVSASDVPQLSGGISADAVNWRNTILAKSKELELSTANSSQSKSTVFVASSASSSSSTASANQDQTIQLLLSILKNTAWEGTYKSITGLNITSKITDTIGTPERRAVEIKALLKIVEKKKNPSDKWESIIEYCQTHAHKIAEANPMVKDLINIIKDGPEKFQERYSKFQETHEQFKSNTATKGF